MLPIATYVMATEPLGARLAEAIPGRAAIYDTRFSFDYYRALPEAPVRSLEAYALEAIR